MIGRTIVPAVALALALALGWSGCFFDTRTPEAPTGDDTSGTRWRNASTPERLVENVRVTTEDRQIDFYARALREDFAFRADRLDSEDFALQSRQPFADWDETVERDNMQRIFDRADRIHLQFTEIDPVISEISPDTARIGKHYELSIVEVDSVAPGEFSVDSSFYKGTLFLFIRDQGPEWAMYRWEDARPAELDLSSWGKLRGDTRP